MNAANYLYISALLFTIGAVGVVVRRNAIVVFMCIELMLNAANLSFVTFSRINGDLDGQVMAFFTMVVAAGIYFTVRSNFYQFKVLAVRSRLQPKSMAVNTAAG